MDLGNMTFRAMFTVFTSEVRISEVRDYFMAEIKEREWMSKRFSKYIASLDYFDKSLIILSATSGGISLASFTTVVGTSCRNRKCKF